MISAKTLIYISIIIYLLFVYTVYKEFLNK